jgi:hypothetical protein
MKFDSQEWRQRRNELLHRWIGDPNAVAFLLDVFAIGEVWDDLVDKDKPVSSEDVNKVFYTALITLPNNPFYQAYRPQLSGVMVAGIHAWIDSTTLEKGDKTDRAIAFVLRDWYMELLTLVATLLHGFDYAQSISLEMRRFFFHESLDEYLGEPL